MVTNVKVKTPGWYLFSTETFLVWFLLGTAMFIFESTADPVILNDFFGETTGKEISERPFWASAVYAVIVFSGLVGCILILMQHRLAVKLLSISFLASITEQFYWWFILEIGNSLKGADWILPFAIPLISLSVLLIARKGISKGWLH